MAQTQAHYRRKEFYNTHMHGHAHAHAHEHEHEHEHEFVTCACTCAVRPFLLRDDEEGCTLKVKRYSYTAENILGDYV